EGLAGLHTADALGAAIVEKTGQADAEKRGAPDPFSELAPKLAFTRDDGNSLHTLRSEQARQNDGHERARGEQRDRGSEYPCEDDARIKGAECPRRPTDKQQECDDYE